MKPLKKIGVTIRHLSMRFGTTEVLKDINLAVEPGEFFALLGPSGSGKTTLLRIIAGFQSHQGGELLIDGRNVAGLAPHQRKVGMVFQNYALWPHLTVFDNVAFGLVEMRVVRAQIKERVQTVLQMVGLSEHSSDYPATLSGGEQQRAALARTLVVEPQVLLLDEPFSNLDKRLRTQMRADLRSLQRELGITTIFVTHDQEEAMTIADRMAVLDAGLLQQTGTTAGVFDYPINRFVAGFLGTANVLEGQICAVSSETVSFEVRDLGLLVLPRLHLMTPRIGAAAITFRPHHVTLRVSDERVDASRIWLNGTIQSSEFMGEFSRYRVRVGDIKLVADEPHYSGQSLFSAGACVRLGIEPTQIRFLDS